MQEEVVLVKSTGDEYQRTPLQDAKNALDKALKATTVSTATRRRWVDEMTVSDQFIYMNPYLMAQVLLYLHDLNLELKHPEVEQFTDKILEKYINPLLQGVRSEIQVREDYKRLNAEEKKQRMENELNVRFIRLKVRFLSYVLQIIKIRKKIRTQR